MTHRYHISKAIVLSAWLFLSLLILCGVSIFLGSANLSFKEVLKALFFVEDESTISIILWQIRIPRLVLAIVVGASLALAGAIMQSLFRNPLADPSITGVSSGAALGAVIYISLFNQIPFGIQIFAFVFGMLAYLFIFFLGRIDSKISTLSLLLAGIAVNAFCAAIVAFFMYTVRDSGLRGFIFWTLGSLNFASWQEIIPASIFSLAIFVFMLFKAKTLNLLLLGEQQAYYSGIDVVRMQFICAFCAASLTAVSVALCGIISFVGLVVPHIVRMIVGANNAKVLPVSILAGANLIVLADIISRVYNPTDPVPIGVITAFIGAPFFAYILRFKK